MTTGELKSYRYYRGRGYRADMALSYARAEAEAKIREWVVEWEYDDLTVRDTWPDHDDLCPTFRRAIHEGSCRHAGRDCQHEIFCAVLRDADRLVLDCLGGIIDPSDTYRREIEAELAVNALSEEEHARGAELRKVYGL